MPINTDVAAFCREYGVDAATVRFGSPLADAYCADPRGGVRVFAPSEEVAGRLPSAFHMPSLGTTVDVTVETPRDREIARELSRIMTDDSSHITTDDSPHVSPRVTAVAVPHLVPGVAVTGSADGFVQGWDLETVTPKYMLKNGGGAITALAASRDGKWVAAGSDRGTATLWNVGTGAVVCEFKHPDGFVEMVVSHDGTCVTLRDTRKNVFAYANGAKSPVTLASGEYLPGPYRLRVVDGVNVAIPGSVGFTMDEPARLGPFRSYGYVFWVASDGELKVLKLN